MNVILVPFLHCCSVQLSLQHFGIVHLEDPTGTLLLPSLYMKIIRYPVAVGKCISPPGIRANAEPCPNPITSMNGPNRQNALVPRAQLNVAR